MAARAAVVLLLLLRPARGLENKYNENPDCDPSALLGGAPPAPLAAPARCTRSRDLALVGNSVTRHVYFSIANVLRSGEVGDVVAAGARIRVDRMYRAEEKRRCNPRRRGAFGKTRGRTIAKRPRAGSTRTTTRPRSSAAPATRRCPATATSSRTGTRRASCRLGRKQKYSTRL